MDSIGQRVFWAWYKANMLFTEKKKAEYIRLSNAVVTRGGIEPPLPPWKGGVLAAWPTGLS